MLIHMFVIYFDNISRFRLSVSFWQIKMVSCVLICSSLFYYLKKIDQRNCSIKFCAKNEIRNVQGHMKCWLWNLASLQWAEHKFNCSITGLRKTDKMLMTMLVLVARAHQQLIKSLKQWRKWFWIIVKSLSERLLMMLAYRSAHAKQSLWMF